jgi:hypothetical protein
MRAILISLLLAVSLSAAAQEYRYLIPMMGYLASDDGTYYYAYTVVQSLTPRNATIVTAAMYPLSAGRPCRSPEPWTVRAGERARVSPMSCMAAVSAMEIISNEPLSVRTELDTHKTMASGWDRQIISASTDWIPAGVTSISEAVILEDQGRRANLLAINPSDTAILLTIEMSRPEYRLSKTLTVEVPAQSMRFASLAEVRNPTPPPPFIASMDGRHLLRITSTGPWQGGVSSRYQGPSMYVPATPLLP